jgi:hypothetical protein
MIVSTTTMLGLLLVSAGSSAASPARKARRSACQAKFRGDRTHHPWAAHVSRTGLSSPSALDYNSAVSTAAGTTASIAAKVKAVTTPLAVFSAPLVHSNPTSAVAPTVKSSITAGTLSAAPANPTIGISGDVGSPVGLALDFESQADGASFGPSVSWYYSWALYTLPGTAGLEFVPMVKTETEVRAFTPDKLGNAKHVLSLNERE